MRKSKQLTTKWAKKAQYILDSQTAKTLTLSWVNVCKYEFLTVEDVDKGLE